MARETGLLPSTILRALNEKNPQTATVGSMIRPTDLDTADALDAALVLKRIAGVGAAARSLYRSKVPVALALRVLARPRAWRR